MKLRIVSITALAATLVGCGGTATTSGQATPRAMTGTLTFAGFDPFTGPDASFGPELMAGCYSAIKLINDGGGVLGHQVQCQPVDSRGDPADAVPAAEKMLATTTNLVGVLGPSSDEARATEILINRAKIPMFGITGEAAYDRTTDPYFWRILPPDDVVGYAMALWAKKKGYQRGASIFGSDIGSQGTVPSLLAGFKKVGLPIVINEKLTLDQSSYRTEVERMIAANPDVIMTEMDPQSSATFFTELKELKGSLLPIVGTAVTIQTPYLQAVAGAIGPQNMSQYFVALQPYAPATGSAYDAFNTALLASSTNVPQPDQWSTDSYSMSNYDAITIMALAMVAAKATDPVFYNPYIQKVTSAAAGATVVHTYAEGKSALEAGKTIQYVGAAGVVAFNQWHNSPGGYEVAGYQSNGQLNLVDAFTADQIAALTK